MSCVECKAIPCSLLPSVQPEERMEEAMGTLCGDPFLARREEWYDMHRFVHLAMRVWIGRHGDAAEVTENKPVVYGVRNAERDDMTEYMSALVALS